MKKIIFTISLILLLITSAFALTIPHAFYGTAEYSNGPIPDGTIITAKLNSVEVKTCQITDGKYGYGQDSLIITDDNEQGGTITFHIGEIKANEEYTFESGSVTELDLTFPGTAPECTEDWTCTEWSICSENTQTRTCSDNNDCGTTTSKPTESQSCDVTPVDTGGSSDGGSSGGGSSGSSGGSGSSPVTTVSFDIDLSESSSAEASIPSGNSNSLSFDGSTGHTIKASQVRSDSAIIIISSDPISFPLNVGETKEVDVNQDNLDDLKVTLTKILGITAYLDIERLEGAEYVDKEGVVVEEDEEEESVMEEEAEVKEETESETDSNSLTGAVTGINNKFSKTTTIFLIALFVIVLGALGIARFRKKK